MVDFFAVWCTPCKLQGPIIEEAAEEMEEKIIVGKLDVESSQQTANQYEVMSISTLSIFKDGKLAESLMGMQDKENLLATIEKYL